MSEITDKELDLPQGSRLQDILTGSVRYLDMHGSERILSMSKVIDQIIPSDKELERYKRIEENAQQTVKHARTAGLYTLADRLETALKPIEPDTYCGLTEEEWKRVLDEEFDLVTIISGNISHYSKLDHVDFKQHGGYFFQTNGRSFSEATLRREIGHRQPYFKRLGTPDIEPKAKLAIWFKDEKFPSYIDMSGMRDKDWLHVREYIQLTKGSG